MTLATPLGTGTMAAPICRSAARKIQLALRQSERSAFEHLCNYPLIRLLRFHPLVNKKGIETIRASSDSYEGFKRAMESRDELMNVKALKVKIVRRANRIAGAVSWESKNNVLVSSESEHVSLAEAVKETIYLKGLLTEIG
ncbi:hypothetical protein EVAR_98227_1 [Eumeta japonica]|uniref:Uncharacterized protein n=1 Tax=Eumeta variegata TaxID=151549 RepID=A0A4C2A5K6_EUMVA|nr:hypothetical protein EVAR_98227_1 [Eumeta japonica]